MAWGLTYQVLYPAVTVGRVAPLVSVADSTAGCAARWTHMANGQMPYWSWIPCIMAGRVAPLAPTANTITLNSPLSGSSNHFNMCFVLNLYMHVGYTIVGLCRE